MRCLLRWYVVDHWGRRPILLSGAAIMAVALSLIGYFMYLDATFTPMAVVICVIIYNACVARIRSDANVYRCAQLLRLLVGTDTGAFARLRSSSRLLTTRTVALPT